VFVGYNKDLLRERTKHKNQIKAFFAIIIILSGFLIVSIVYNFLGGFYYCRVISFDKMLGERQTIIIDGEGAFSCAANFSGSLVVGGDIKQPIDVLIEDVETPLFLRAKFKINGLDYNMGYMFGYSNWQQANDGYIYLNQQAQPFDKVGLCNTLKINAQMDLKSSTDYIMIFIVESSKTAWEYEVI